MIPELESILAGKEQKIEEIRRELAEASSAVEVLQANALRDQKVVLNQVEHCLQEEFTLMSIGVAGHNNHKGSLQKEISMSLAFLSSQGDVAGRALSNLIRISLTTLSPCSFSSEASVHASMSSEKQYIDCPYSPGAVSCHCTSNICSHVSSSRAICLSGNCTANHLWAWIKFLNETNFAAILLPYEDKPLFFKAACRS